jgi:1-acyl-sn-glycerol-3-phosphate acyltransferase
VKTPQPRESPAFGRGEEVKAEIDPAWRAPLLWRVLMVAARVLVALVGRLRVTGDVPAQLRGAPVLMASNHVGNFDPVVLVAAMRTRRLAPRLLATAGLFRAPVLGAVLKACGHIPVNRGSATAAEALHEAEAALAGGAVVTMYPEGRIGLDPGMWPERGKTGMARLALRTRAHVVPVAQWGAHEILAYHGTGAMAVSLLRAVVRRPVLRVHFGPPVDLSDLTAGTTGAALRATERIMQAVTDALEPLRVTEPRLPRRVDRTRPLSTARTREPRHRDPVPAGSRAASRDGHRGQEQWPAKNEITTRTGGPSSVATSNGTQRRPATAKPPM